MTNSNMQHLVSPVRFTVFAAFVKLSVRDPAFLVQKAPFKYSPIMVAWRVDRAVPEVLPVDAIYDGHRHYGSTTTEHMSRPLRSYSMA